MNPVQKRTGSASASSQESQDVAPASRVATQLDSSTLLPAPAEPTTTVSRLAAPVSSRPCSAGLVSSVVGSVVGRNFVSANRMSWEAPRRAAGRCGMTAPAVPSRAVAETMGGTVWASSMPGLWRASRL
jgi:hypothetical protein